MGRNAKAMETYEKVLEMNPESDEAKQGDKSFLNQSFSITVKSLSF